MRLLIGDSRQNEQVESEIVDELVARQVDGILLASPYSRVDAPRRAARCGCPHGPDRLPRTGAGSADRRHRTHPLAPRSLVAHLAGHGRRRIGLIIGDSGFGNPDPRERGWRIALRAADLPDGPMVDVALHPGGRLCQRTGPPRSGPRLRRRVRQQRPAGHRTGARAARTRRPDPRGRGRGLLRRHQGVRVLLAAAHRRAAATSPTLAAAAIDLLDAPAHRAWHARRSSDDRTHAPRFMRLRTPERTAGLPRNRILLTRRPSHQGRTD